METLKIEPASLRQKATQIRTDAKRQRDIDHADIIEQCADKIEYLHAYMERAIALTIAHRNNHLVIFLLRNGLAGLPIPTSDVNEELNHYLKSTKL